MCFFCSSLFLLFPPFKHRNLCAGGLPFFSFALSVDEMVPFFSSLAARSKEDRRQEREREREQKNKGPEKNDVHKIQERHNQERQDKEEMIKKCALDQDQTSSIGKKKVFFACAQ